MHTTTQQHNDLCGENPFERKTPHCRSISIYYSTINNKLQYTCRASSSHKYH